MTCVTVSFFRLYSRVYTGSFPTNNRHRRQPRNKTNFPDTIFSFLFGGVSSIPSKIWFDINIRITKVGIGINVNKTDRVFI